MPDDDDVRNGAAARGIAGQTTPGGGWTPVPDPTKLTAEAVEKATEQNRRDLAGLREIIETRLRGNDEARELLTAELRDWPIKLENRLERRRREFLEDLAGVRELVEQRLADLDKAIKLAADELSKLPDKTEAERARLDAETTRRLAAEREFVMGQIELARAETQRTGDVAQEKFAAIDGLFNSNDKALTAALAAQEKAAAEQQKSNTLAIDKSEKTTIETIRANDDKTASAIQAQAATIADLKERIVRIEATGAGATSVTGSPYEASALAQDARIATEARQRAAIAIMISAILAVVAIASLIFAIAKK